MTTDAILARTRELQTPVMRLLCAVTGDERTAAELALQAFERAARRGDADHAASTVRVFREALRLSSLAAKENIRREPSRRAAEQPEFDLPDGEIPRPFVSQEDQAHMRLAGSLAVLPKLKRDVVLLHFAAGLPADQIARVCGVTTRRVEQELENVPPVPRELLRVRSTVRTPWFFEAVLLQRLSSASSQMAARRWLQPAGIAVIILVISGVAFVLFESLGAFRGSTGGSSVSLPDSSVVEINGPRDGDRRLLPDSRGARSRPGPLESRPVTPRDGDSASPAPGTLTDTHAVRHATMVVDTGDATGTPGVIETLSTAAPTRIAVLDSPRSGLSDSGTGLSPRADTSLAPGQLQ
jgi:DNA-directed RNA polymerase specialized sigma24 family protein